MSRAGDDEEFEFERGLDAAPGGPKGAAVAGTVKPNVSVSVPGGAGGNQQLSSSLRVTDQHYDEAVDVHDESAASVVSPEHSPGGSAKPPGGAAGAGPGSSKAADLKVDTSAKASQPAPPAIGASAKAGTPHVAPKAAATPSRGGASASTAAAAAAAAAAGSTAHHNKPGEVHDVDDHAHAQAQAQAAAAQAAAAQAQGAAAAGGGGDLKEGGGLGGGLGGGMGGALGAAVARPKPVLPLYNADEYRNLPGVTQEIQDMFDHISRYKPKHIELETKLKPFVPDFIPAVGDIDHFLKPPLPGGDNKKDMLGLVSLDEPAAVQSDPTVLELLLRQSSRKADIKPMTVRSIEHAAANPKKITAWITNVAEVMRKKPPPAVHYPKPMPDVEQLMQVWPQDFEDALKSMTLPGAELGMELRDYCRVVCAVLDIPVHDGRPIAESLHLLFTLFAEFKQNAAFAQAGGAAFPVAAAAAANGGAGGSNSLVISGGGDAKSDKKK